MSIYSEKVLEHFRNPKNVGEIENPDGVGEVGNPICGDLMRITIRVGSLQPALPRGRSVAGRKKETEKPSKKQKAKSKLYISDIKFQTFGCGAAIATSSITTELAKGKTIEEAEKITNKDIAEALKGLPAIKMHCSNLAADALKKAIKDYRSKNPK